MPCLAMMPRGALDDGVTLTLTLMTDGEDVNLPLMMGEITARVTLIDTEMGIDTFDDAFTSPPVIFEIRPAQCELLFPVVSVLPNRGNWDTAISVNQPGVWGRNGFRRSEVHLLWAWGVWRRRMTLQ